MQVKRVNRVNLISMIKAGEVSAALAEFLSCYSDPLDQDGATVYDGYTTLQGQMRADPEFLSPSYISELLAIRALTPEGSADSQKIADLLNEPLPVKCRLFRKPVSDYLSDPVLNDRLMKVQPLHPHYLAFELPEEVKVNCISKAKLHKLQRIESRGADMDFSQEEVSTLFNLAMSIIDQPQQRTPADIYRYMEALMLMTGRRPNEIWSNVTFLPVQGQPFQAVVRGAAKGKTVAGQPDFVAPLLMPFDMVVLHVNRLRDLIKQKGMKMLSRRQKGTWGRRMTVTHFRGLYCRKAYEQRTNSGFFPNAEYSMFCSKALGHKTPQIISAQAYTSVNVV